MYFPFQGPPKFTQIGMFGLKNKPSGKPGLAIFWATFYKLIWSMT
jgi:hypothetical protein